MFFCVFSQVLYFICISYLLCIQLNLPFRHLYFCIRTSSPWPSNSSYVVFLCIQSSFVLHMYLYSIYYFDTCISASGRPRHGHQTPRMFFGIQSSFVFHMYFLFIVYTVKVIISTLVFLHPDVLAMAIKLLVCFFLIQSSCVLHLY
jgi:hypothetical protein